MILISSKRIGFSGDSGLRWGSTQKPVAAVWSRAKGFPAVDRQRSSGQFQKAHFYFFRPQPFKKNSLSVGHRQLAEVARSKLPAPVQPFSLATCLSANWR